MPKSKKPKVTRAKVMEDTLIEEGKKELSEAEALYGKLHAEQSNRMDKWRTAGNHFQAAVNLLRMSGENLTPITEKAIECYSKAAYILKDNTESMPLFAHAGYLSLSLLKQKDKDDLKKECPYDGRVYSFDSTLAGNTWELYLQAALNALNVAEGFEIQNRLKNAALFYGTAGDYYFSQYITLTILPKEHLFYSESDQRNTLFKAAECYLKSVKLSRAHGIPSISYWIRQSDHYVVFGDFFDAKKKTENSVLDDMEKARFIYEFLANKTDKYGNLSKKRIRCIEELDEFVTIADEVNLFEKRMRDFIEKVMPKDKWMMGLSEDLLRRIEDRKNVEKQFGMVLKRNVDYLEMLDYSKVIRKHWESTFKSIFGDSNQQDVTVFLKSMASVYRNPEFHSRETTLDQKGHFNINAQWFYGYFDSVK